MFFSFTANRGDGTYIDNRIWVRKVKKILYLTKKRKMKRLLKLYKEVIEIAWGNRNSTLKNPHRKLIWEIKRKNIDPQGKEWDDEERVRYE